MADETHEQQITNGRDGMRSDVATHAQGVGYRAASGAAEQHGNPADAVARSDARYGEAMVAVNELEAWPNPRPERPFLIHEETPEFTCLCPRSGFPDFATLTLDYVPGASVVELRSLKLYVNGFRDRRLSHEGAVNEIAETLVALLQPRTLRLIGRFTRRGNIDTTVVATFEAGRGWVADLPPIDSNTQSGERAQPAAQRLIRADTASQRRRRRGA